MKQLPIVLDETRIDGISIKHAGTVDFEFDYFGVPAPIISKRWYQCPRDSMRVAIENYIGIFLHIKKSKPKNEYYILHSKRNGDAACHVLRLELLQIQRDRNKIQATLDKHSHTLFNYYSDEPSICFSGNNYCIGSQPGCLIVR